MQKRVLGYIRKHGLMRPGDRVGVAVSGGADSVALLHLLLEARDQLGIVLSVVHFNHKIRGADADADENFVRDLARGFGLEFHSDSADTPAYARGHKLSLEAAGRHLRYQFFARLLSAPPSAIGNRQSAIGNSFPDLVGPSALAGADIDRAASCGPAAAPRRGNTSLDKIATAHTRDDQAETVLLRFLRGAGTRGLAGIYPSLRVAGHDFSRAEQGPIRSPALAAVIVRPLLDITHIELRAYLDSIHQPWREDATNRDVSYARNRVRHELLPLLRHDFNPALDQVLAETAAIARAEEEYWAEEVASTLPQIVTQSAIANRQSAIDLASLLEQPLALQRRLLRAAAEAVGLRLDFHHVDQIFALITSPPAKSEKVLELPDAWQAVRRDRELCFRGRCQSQQERHEYDIPLFVPGEVEVAGRTIRAALVSREGVELAGEGARATKVLLTAELAECPLHVRNWHAGDRYQPAHTAAPKKLKELLQARHIPRAQKSFWPVVVSGDEIIWVPGFAAPEKFRFRDPKAPALLLEEVPLQPEDKIGP